jgi:murein DD-endopeptidase MepM/ murein hydrolase activator NlpD
MRSRGGGAELVADRSVPAEWETFIIVNAGSSSSGRVQSGDKIAFKTQNGRFIVAEGGGGDVVRANRVQRGEWETFKIQILGAPAKGKLSAPFTRPDLIIGFPVGVDEGFSGNVPLGDVITTCRNSFLGINFPNCYKGHTGTDFGLVGGFAAMNLGSIDVIAAAAGKVVAISNGNPDRCYFKFPPPPPNSAPEDYITCPNDPDNKKIANFVVVLQDDGLLAYYYHLKSDSIPVSVGRRVECGELLGKIGSSGISSAPHLHFDLRERSDGVFPSNSSDFSQVTGKVVNPYAPMLWTRLIGRVPQQTCGQTGSSCDGVKCLPGWVCQDGKCVLPPPSVPQTPQLPPPPQIKFPKP